MRTLLLLLPLLLAACSVQRYDPRRKLSPAQLEADYTLFRNLLEDTHPSLYWYTPKDSMDLYFERGRARLRDSLTEPAFRQVLNYVVAAIRCGHTAVSPSRAAARYNDSTNPARSFPLGVKLWPDTALVTLNIDRRDSLLHRGSVLHSIGGQPIRAIIDTMFRFLPADGYNETHKYQTLSNPGTFRNLYASLYGFRDRTPVTFTDTLGVQRASVLRSVRVSSGRGDRRTTTARERRLSRLQGGRAFRVDSATGAGILEMNTFLKGYRLRPFLRRTFRRLRREERTDLVLDLRGNFGGSVSASNLLTRYLSQEPFKIADSLYAVSTGSRYSRYLDDSFINRLFFMFFTRKNSEGRRHFRFYEGRYFKPKGKNRFRGNVYVLTGGNTFSAASLVASALRPQRHALIVGEETGGGAYGNSAWLIPTATLPQSRVRMRVPLFRLVIDTTAQKGRGVFPEVEAGPTRRDIIEGRDFKLEKALELIRQSAMGNRE